MIGNTKSILRGCRNRNCAPGKNANNETPHGAHLNATDGIIGESGAQGVTDVMRELAQAKTALRRMQILAPPPTRALA